MFTEPVILPLNPLCSGLPTNNYFHEAVILGKLVVAVLVKGVRAVSKRDPSLPCSEDPSTGLYEGDSISKLQIVIEKSRMEIMTYK